MPVREANQELSESAHQVRELMTSSISSLQELDSDEALWVAREAARDLVLLITDLQSTPAGINVALTEISTICQHGIVANTRKETDDC